MLSPDFINALFEGIGGGMMWLNVRQILKDKSVRGVHLGPSFFFNSWGLWNLFYYPHLGQPWSFLGGVVMTLASLTWTGIAIYMKRRGTCSATNATAVTK